MIKLPFNAKRILDVYYKYKSTKNSKKLAFILLLLFTMGFAEVVAVYSIMLAMVALSGGDIYENYNILGYVAKYLGAEDGNMLILLVQLSVVSLILSNILNMISLRKIMKLSYSVGGFISLEIYKRYLFKSYIDFLKIDNSEKIKNIINSVDKLVDGVIIPVAQLLIKSISSFAIIFLLLYIDYRVALMVVVYLVMLIYIYHVFTRKIITRVGDETNKLSSKKISYAISSFDLKKEVDIYNLHSFFMESFSSITNAYASNEAKRSIVAQLPKYIMEIVAVLTLVLASFSMHHTGYSNDQIIPIISMYLFAGYRLMPFVHNVFTTYTSASYQYPLVLDVLEVLDGGFDIKNNTYKKNSLYLSNLKCDKNIILSLKNVSFSFNELKILNSINLNISLGKSIAIVGKSGEGKSTLINIMAGLFKADDGDVCICNLRKLSYVSQKTQIMNTSLKENIVFGSEYCSENFSRVLDLTLLKDVVKRLPKNENSMIGEKGDLLSGGQLQRVGIARALYKNPNLLIMDEGTNSLDFYTENSILKNILNLNIAIIFVTHNIKIAHYFDETYSLDGGSLVEYALFKE